MSRARFLFPFVILLGLLLGLERTEKALPIVIALFIHEIGHIIAVKLVGGSIIQSSFFGIGADIGYEKRTLSTRSEIIIYLAGPIFGFVGAFVGYIIKHYVFVKCSFILSMINLIPAIPLDGGNILKTILPISVSDKIMCILSLCLGFVFILYGLYNIYCSGNFSSFVLGISIFISNIPKRTLQ